MRTHKLKAEIRDAYERWKLLPWYQQVCIVATILWLPYILIGFWLTNKLWFGKRNSWRRVLIVYGVMGPVVGFLLALTGSLWIALPIFVWTLPLPIMIATGPYEQKSAIIEEDERK